jgi:hypothetical protein
MSLVWSPGFNGVTDPDAQTYIAAVEAADGQAIEGNVAYAINDFVVGCKDDGIWDAIKASCILAGARTLSGALVPLKGTAPTVSGFVSSDYNRETGLAKTINATDFDTNRSNTADPQNNQHLSVWIDSHTYRGSLIASQGTSSYNGQSALYQNESGTNVQPKIHVAGGASKVTQISSGKVNNFWGASRNSASSYVSRANSVDYTLSYASAFDDASNIKLLASSSMRARLSFYSIGEAIDLEKLDTRTTRLMNLLSYSLASGLPGLSTMDPDAASYIGAVYRAGGTLS